MAKTPLKPPKYKGGYVEKGGFKGYLHNQALDIKRNPIIYVLLVIILGVISIYINSMLASPTYVDGKLVSVDFWTNFFFTIQNPLGIKITAIWQWWLYLVIISILSCISVVICYLPLLLKQKK